MSIWTNTICKALNPINLSRELNVSDNQEESLSISKTHWKKTLKDDKKLECSLFEVQLDDINTMNFCLIYRPESVKLNYFFEGFFTIDRLEERAEKNNMKIFRLSIILKLRLHYRRVLPQVQEGALII